MCIYKEKKRDTTRQLQWPNVLSDFILLNLVMRHVTHASPRMGMPEHGMGPWCIGTRAKK